MAKGKKKKDFTSDQAFNPYTLWLLGIVFVLSGLLIDFYHRSSKQTELKPAVVTLSHEPSVKLYKNFITPVEAKHLIHLAKERLKRSTVQINGEKVVDTQRTSSSAHLAKAEDEIVKEIERRACALVNCNESHMEPLQIVHYTQGQKYSLHYDYFSEAELQHQSGQRVHTFLVYLNNVSEKDGGTTIFPELYLDVAPTLGTALYFRDTDEQGKTQPKTLHGGSEIKTKGIEKWACNIWIRDKPYVDKNKPTEKIEAKDATQTGDDINKTNVVQETILNEAKSQNETIDKSGMDTKIEPNDKIETNLNPTQ